MKYKSVEILGTTFKISYLKKMEDAGRCNFAKYTIDLDAELLKYPKAHYAVLCHEIAHAFMHESGLYEFMEAQAQEMLAQNLSSFIVNFTRNLK